jgi:hypothetical protein
LLRLTPPEQFFQIKAKAEHAWSNTERVPIAPPPYFFSGHFDGHQTQMCGLEALDFSHRHGSNGGYLVWLVGLRLSSSAHRLVSLYPAPDDSSDDYVEQP